MKANGYILTVLIILLTPFTVAADITIGAGTAEIFNNNGEEARKQAINNAFRDIIKKEVALLLDPVTILKHRAAIREGLYNKARDFIKNYEIVKDELKNKSRYIQIEADIVSKAVKEHLEELNILRSKINPKRLIAVYNPRCSEALPLENIAAQSALNAVVPEFGEFVFQVVDWGSANIYNKSAEEREIMKKCLGALYNSTRTENANKACAAVQDKHLLDTLVEFEIIPYEEDVSPDLLFSYAAAAVKMKAYDLSIRKLISNVEARQWQLTDAEKGSSQWSNAVSGAAEKSAGTAASETAKNMLKYYKESGDITTDFLIIFQNVSEDEKGVLAIMLQKIEGYKSMLPSGDFDSLKIQYLSSLDKKRLAMKILLALKESGLKAKYRELSGNRLLFESF